MMLRRAVIPLFFVLFLACAGGDRIAGTKGGSETTNGVTACVYRADRTPARGSPVRLRRSEYVSRQDALGKAAKNVVDTLTDELGRFTIVGIDPGAYRIEVNESARGGGALLLSVDVGTADIVDLGTHPLEPYATITGTVDTAGAEGGRFYVQIRGLERFVRVGENGAFTFVDMPAGRFDVRVAREGNDARAREIVNIKTVPGETAPLRVSGNSAFAGYLYLDAAAGAPLAAPLLDFPLLVRLDSSSFEFSAASPDGRDVRFAKIDGAPLAYEIEQWDVDARTAAVWVKMDTVTGMEQRLLMYWGNATATESSNGAAVFDTARGFAGVWHLCENPDAGAGIIRDRTANAYDGTPFEAMTATAVVAGVIGDALGFDGKDDYIGTGPLNVEGCYSLSCWVRADDLGTARRFIWKEYSYTLWYDAIGGGVRVEHFTDSLVWRGIYQDNSRLIPLQPGTWHFLAGTFDGDRIRLYIDGELRDSTRAIGALPHSSPLPLSLGGRSGEFLEGVMDEVRIERTARSPEWIRFCYLNQKPNSEMISFTGRN